MQNKVLTERHLHRLLRVERDSGVVLSMTVLLENSTSLGEFYFWKTYDIRYIAQWHFIGHNQFGYT